MRFVDIFEADWNTEHKPRRTTDLESNDELIAKMRHECATAIALAAEGRCLWRGATFGKNSIAYGDSSQYNRPSKNTTNHYTLLLQLLPSWRNMPQRNKSFVCSQSYSYANSYGDKYGNETRLVLPVGDPLVGVVNSTDFWEGFPGLRVLDGIENMDDLNKLLRAMLRCADLPHTPSTPQELDSSLDRVTELMGDPDSFEEYRASFSNYQRNTIDELANQMEEHGNIQMVFDHILNPHNNNIKAVKFSTLPSGKSEVWFAGPAYFINRHHAKEVLNILKDE